MSRLRRTEKFIAYNFKTGLYWNGLSFSAHCAEQAAILDDTQLSVLRYTYMNVRSANVHIPYN